MLRYAVLWMTGNLPGNPASDCLEICIAAHFCYCCFAGGDAMKICNQSLTRPVMAVQSWLALLFLFTALLTAVTQNVQAESSKRLFSTWPAASRLASSSAPGTRKSPCKCVYKGRRYQLGDLVCIRLPGASPRSVRCGLVLNNTSWISAPGACSPIS